MSVASNAWARRHHAALLAQLEAEERAGWPDLPWPPVVHLPQSEQLAIVERIVGHLYGVMRDDEIRHKQAHAAAVRETWRNTGLPKRAA